MPEKSGCDLLARALHDKHGYAARSAGNYRRGQYRPRKKTLGDTGAGAWRGRKKFKKNTGLG
jgi:hypothetical protein